MRSQYHYPRANTFRKGAEYYASIIRYCKSINQSWKINPLWTGIFDDNIHCHLALSRNSEENVSEF